MLYICIVYRKKLHMKLHVLVNRKCNIYCTDALAHRNTHTNVSRECVYRLSDVFMF